MRTNTDQIRGFVTDMTNTVRLVIISIIINRMCLLVLSFWRYEGSGSYVIYYCKESFNTYRLNEKSPTTWVKFIQPKLIRYMMAMNPGVINFLKIFYIWLNDLLQLIFYSFIHGVFWNNMFYNQILRQKKQLKHMSHLYILNNIYII